MGPICRSLAVLFFAAAITMVRLEIAIPQERMSKAKAAACAQIGYVMRYLDVIVKNIEKHQKGKLDAKTLVINVSQLWRNIEATNSAVSRKALGEGASQRDRELILDLRDKLHEEISQCKANLDLFSAGVDVDPDELAFYESNCIDQFEAVDESFCSLKKSSWLTEEQLELRRNLDPQVLTDAFSHSIDNKKTAD